MAHDGFQEITLGAVNIKEHINENFDGYYCGSTEKDSLYGTSIIHHLEGEDGANYSIYGFTMLNQKLANVKDGDFIRIIYTGTEKIKTKKFGLKDVHQVKVLINRNKHTPID